jgi:CheY-like chemotaxis protein
VNVLVVDDEPDALELLRRVLTDAEATVTCAAGATEALERLHESAPDVVVSDIGMPGRDGYWLIEQIRSLDAPKTRRTPAVALTAFAGPQDRLRALQAGFQIHVPKPVEPAELVSVVATAAGRDVASA